MQGAQGMRGATWLGLRPLAADEQRTGPFALRRTFQFLRFGLAAVFLVSGFDKFVHGLARWVEYVAPDLLRITPFGAYSLTRMAGVVEIAAAALCVLRPRTGGWMLTGWLGLVILNRLMLGAGYDHLLGAIGLGVASVTLARLAAHYER